MAKTERHSAGTARAAVIGCGAMGRNHAVALSTMDDVDLVGLADVVPENLERLGDEVGVSSGGRYHNYQELLQDESLDFVVVATQAPQHAEITTAAAAQQINILCEKPLALNLLEADSMVAACKDAGVILAVNHILRAAPANILARDLVADGEIGDVLAIEIHDKGGRPVGNSLMEMATHYFDEARFILGASLLGDGRRSNDLEWVFAHLSTGVARGAHPASANEIVPSQVALPTDRDCGLVLGERGTIVLGFAGEVQAVARFHNLPVADYDYQGMDIVGTKGSLALRGDFHKRLYRRVGHTFTSEDPWRLVPIPDSEHFFGLEYFDAVRALCQNMARDMVEAMTDGREHVSSGHDGLVALESLMAVYVSHRQKAPVVLPLEDRTHPLVRWKESAS